MSKNTNMFELAVRGKYRFYHNGILTVEDLWDLSMNDLDSIFKKLNKEAKSTAEESLLKDTSRVSKALATSLEILRYIVETKQEEAQVKEDRKLRAERRAKLIAEKERRDGENITQLSDEELKKELEHLD